MPKEKTSRSKKIYEPELARAMTYAQVAEGEEATDSDYVKFDAFFLRDLDGDGVAEEIRGTCKQIGKQDTLYMNLNVNTNGYLKDGKITINGNNFYLETSIPKENENGIIKENAIGLNTKEIQLRDVKNGTQKLLTGFVKSGDYRYESTKAEAIGNNINNYSKVNSITLTGIHVADDGTETPIEKTIEFQTEWYGTAEAQLPEYLGYINYKRQQKYLEEIFDEENDEINLDFEVLVKESKSELIIQKSALEAEIPRIGEYSPSKVEVINADYNYDPETRILTAEKIAKTDENGNITQKAYTMLEGTDYNKERYNIYQIKVTYPLEAYRSLGEEKIEIQVPIRSYYAGYNNNNEGFSNPYISNTAKDTIIVMFEKYTGSASNIYTYVGKYVQEPSNRYLVSKKNVQNIYNNIATTEKDTYKVVWNAFTGTSGKEKKLTLKDTKTNEIYDSNVFVKRDGTEETMEDFTNNIGIYFENAKYMLGEDGWIKVYDDETNELLVTFTNENWNNYTEIKPYKYKIPVKHIRIETSETKVESNLYITNIKELDDEKIAEHYTEQEFKEISYIKSKVELYLNDQYAITDGHLANYEEATSIAEITVDKTVISTQTTEKNFKITIQTKANANYNQEKWTNGTFLIKLPQEIIDLEINDIKINNSNVKISGYEIQEESGNKFIKIITENEKSTIYQITIDCNITPDPRITTSSRTIELYASNENCPNYYYKEADKYDVNSNQNKEELVGKTSTGINLVAPGSLLTNQLAKKYDSNESEAIAPKIALISKEQRIATIDVEIKNNYSNTISDVVILGKIPTADNTYAITKQKMGSEFSATMTNQGITIPDELKEYTTIYYSEKENTTKDLGDEENRWLKNPTDWSKIKSYLITIDNYTIPVNVAYKFSYGIEIPEGLNYNQVSYSHHGVYFSLDTEEGKYRTQTEPNKLGFMIAKQFNVEITKYQKDAEKLVQGAIYTITEENKEEGKTKTTDEEGNLLIKNLYVEKTYTVKEIKSPEQYEINNNEIKFSTKVKENGDLEATLISGTLKKDTSLEVKQTEEGYTVSIQVEDEVRPNLKLTKLEEGTTNTIAKAKFQLTGKGMPESGRTLTTNASGEVTLNGLYINEEYTLTETSVEGYYLASPIKFEINNNNGEYTIKINEGKIQQSNVTIENEIPTINISIENEKIPRYTLDITKIKKGEPTNVLAGAKFKLIKGDKVLGEYISDNNGKIVIPDLYRYVDGRDVDCTYTLKEVLAPEGYAKVKDITFKVQEIDGELQFQEEVQAGATAKTYTVDENTINLIIEDSPSFKLTKKDGTTKELLPGIKFAIYNIDDGEVPATDSKGNIIGTKEIINGREYYTVITNENGELTADLKEGLYKAVEVEAPVQYDITDNTYYFGIGASREGRTEYLVEWAKKLGGDDEDHFSYIEETNDGDIIAVGEFLSSIIELENGQQLQNTNGAPNTMIVKYDSEKNIKWAKSIGCIETGYDVWNRANGMILTENEDVIVSVTIQGSGIQLENGQQFGGYTFYLIKYNSEGVLQWCQSINGLTINCIDYSKDNEILIGGYINGTIELKNGETISGDGQAVVIKCDNNGDPQWATQIYGNSNIYISCITATDDGGIAVGGNFNGIIELSDGKQIQSRGTSEGMIIKYINNDVSFAKSTGKGYIEIHHITETSDGGIVAGGVLYERIELENGEIIERRSVNDTCVDSIIIKYNMFGNLEWGRQLGGTGDNQIQDLIPTKTNTTFVAGGFYGDTIKLKNGEEIELSTASIMEIDENGEIEWIRFTDVWPFMAMVLKDNGNILLGGSFSYFIEKEDGYLQEVDGGDAVITEYKLEDVPEIIETKNIIKGKKQDTVSAISSIITTDDNGYIAVGYYYGTIEIENNKTLTSEYITGIIQKYSRKGELEWTREIKSTEYSNLTSITETNDNGYIIGGEFSGEIQLENSERLTSIDSAGILIKYNKENEIEWVRGIQNNIKDAFSYIQEVKVDNNGDIIALVQFNGEISIENESVISQNTEQIAIVKYGKDGNLKWIKPIYVDESLAIIDIKITNDNEIIMAGQYQGTIETEIGEKITAKGSVNVIILKYDSNGNKIWHDSIGNKIAIYAKEIVLTDDGGYIVGIVAEDTIEFDAWRIERGPNLIKYNKDGKKEWIKQYLFNEISSVKDGIIVYYDNQIIKTTYNQKKRWTHIFNHSSIDQIIAGEDGSIFITETEYSELGRGSIIQRLKPEMGVQDIQELEITNNIKEFKITTSVKEIDGVKGGTISGNGMTPYEKVKYNAANEKEIKMIPDPNYEIIKITINGEDYQFKTLEDGTYTMPKFTNITEDKNIQVTYGLKDNKITINKTDSETGEKLSGAKFKIEQIDERPEPENSVGSLTDNGQPQVIVQRDKTVNETLGTLTNNGEYYFIEENGTYVPTNSKTYQEANGGTGGIANSTASSYIPIDLTEKEGQYVVSIKARASSECPGCANITENTEAPSYYDGYDDRFMEIGGEYEEEFTSSTLEGGKIYYLHLGYFKFDGQDYGEDRVVIQEVNIYEAELETFNFIETADGKYESTNQGKKDTTCNSYVPINLEGHAGKYNILVNAEMSTINGSAIISVNQNPQNYYMGESKRIIGEHSAEDYVFEVQGGYTYYVHLVYNQSGEDDQRQDKLTINNIQVTLSNSDMYSKEIETNSNGQIITQLLFAKYKITEIQAPKGYYAGEPIEIEFTGDSEHTITIPNTKYAKVTVNHHKAIKNADGTYTDTGEKLAESTTIQGKIGEEYTTAPRLDFEKYELITDIEGKVVIPENYTGNYTEEEQTVTYLYAEKEIPLVVHHYIQDTLLPVPLEDGTTAQEVTESGYEGDNYTTNAIPNEKLSSQYELVETPSNSTGTYRGNKVEVNYYYKKIERNVNIIKYQEDGQTPLAGAKFTITKIEENKAEDTEPTIYTTDEKGKIIIALEVGEYKITEIEAPTGYIIPENATNTVTITRVTTEEKLEITNDRIKGKVIVHHYIKGIDEPVKLKDGTIAQDEIKQKYIGEIYATKPLEDIAEEYEYDSVVGQTSGEYTEETIEITYYYKALVDIDVIKKWNHTNNIYGKPEKLTVELYANGEKIQETTMTKTNKIEVEGEPLTEETWKYTFERLPKYTDEGTEIEYTISEK